MFISATILEPPIKKRGNIHKGAIILSCPDEVHRKIPKVKDYFYIISKRGWRGMDNCETADIKLIEDLSTWDETKAKFPNAILLDLAGADFVDVNNFKPLNIEKNYDAIQIACWQRFKRHELFVKATSLLPNRKFLKFGHFFHREDPEEFLLKENVIKLSEDIGANIDYPFRLLKSNEGLPQSPYVINNYINQCKVGIITSKVEGVNRFKLECLSANIPVLVPEDVSYPTKKHINVKTGVFFKPTPEDLAWTIEYVENNLDKFEPRRYILENTGHKKSLDRLKKALMYLCERDRLKCHFDNIYWDGRNQSLVWGNRALDLITRNIESIK